MWRFEVQNAAMAIRLVAQGAALTILPRSVAEFVPPGIAVRRFADVRPARTVGLVRRRGVPMSEAGAALVHAIETEFARRAEALRDLSGLPHQPPRD